MDEGALYGWAADTILILHFAVVLFIVGAVPAIFIGNLWLYERHSQAINSLWFRLAHLSAILFVMAEAWLQVACPLTTLERWLREAPSSRVARVGDSPAAGCIEYWLGKVLYFTAPWWVFATVYSLFATLVVYTWVKFPPRRSR